MSNISTGVEKKQIIRSSGMAIISFAINIVIGFWTSPFIVSHLGSEAYGFSTLGGNFTTYMSLITIAINAFAARYITIAYHNDDKVLASKYFTSVFFANLVIMGVMLIPILGIVIGLENVLSISEGLVLDVKIQWSLLFLAWMFDLIFKVYSTSTFVQNRLDINYRLTAVSNVIRLVVIVVTFSFLDSHLWFVGLAAIACSTYVNLGYYIAKKRLMPEININAKLFDWECLKTLFLKGIWNSINQLASLLMNGFDLVITNLAVDSISMGLYSVAQTIPTYLQSLMYTLCDLFNPNLTVSYSKGRYNEVKDGLCFAIKLNAIILLVPLMGFLVFGMDFYSLWQSSLNEKDTREVFILSVLVILPMISSIFVQPLLTINTITAKLRVPVYVNILMGVSNIVIELVLVKTTNLGVYAIAGVSTVLLLIRNYLFYPIYCAKQIQMRWDTFYPIITQGAICSALAFGFLFIVHRMIAIQSWFDLLGFALLFGLIAEVMVFFFMLNRNEREKVVGVLKSKIVRR